MPDIIKNIQKLAQGGSAGEEKAAKQSPARYAPEKPRTTQERSQTVRDRKHTEITGEKPRNTPGKKTQAHLPVQGTLYKRVAAGTVSSAAYVTPVTQRNSWEYKANGTRKRFDELTTPEVYSWIGTLKGDEQERARAQFEGDYLRNPASKWYDPYYTQGSNNAEGKALFGVDVFDRDWIDSNRALMNHVSFTNESYSTPKKPGKNATELEKAAYQYWLIANTYESTTKDAESEYAKLRQEVSERARILRASGENISAEELLSEIDWSDYKTLRNLREQAAAGNPRMLNRPVTVGDASLLSMAKAALRGQDVSEDADYIQTESKYLSQWHEPQKAGQPGSAGGQRTDPSRMDAGSADYDPYGGEGSNNELGKALFGVAQFDGAWIEKNRGLLSHVRFKDESAKEPEKPDGDAPEIEKQAYQYWLIANTYEGTTQAAEREMESLRQWMEKQARRSMSLTARELTEAIDWSAYKTLTNLREQAERGNPRMLNRPVAASDGEILRMAKQVLGEEEEEPAGGEQETPTAEVTLAQAAKDWAEEMWASQAEDSRMGTTPEPASTTALDADGEKPYKRTSKGSMEAGSAGMADEAAAYTSDVNGIRNFQGTEYALRYVEEQIRQLSVDAALSPNSEGLKTKLEDMKRQQRLLQEELRSGNPKLNDMGKVHQWIKDINVSNQQEDMKRRNDAQKMQLAEKAYGQEDKVTVVPLDGTTPGRNPDKKPETVQELLEQTRVEWPEKETFAQGSKEAGSGETADEATALDPTSGVIVSLVKRQLAALEAGKSAATDELVIQDYQDRIDELRDQLSAVTQEKARRARELGETPEYNDYVTAIRNSAGVERAIWHVQDQISNLQAAAQYTPENTSLQNELYEMQDQLVLLQAERDARQEIEERVLADVNAQIAQTSEKFGGRKFWEQLVDRWAQSSILSAGSNVPLSDYEAYLRDQMGAEAGQNAEMDKYDYQIGDNYMTDLMSMGTVTIDKGVKKAWNSIAGACEDMLFQYKRGMTQYQGMTREEIYAADADLNALRALNSTFEGSLLTEEQQAQMQEAHPVLSVASEAVSELMKMSYQGGVSRAITDWMGGAPVLGKLVASTESGGVVKAFGFQNLPFGTDAFHQGVERARADGANEDQAFQTGLLNALIIGPVSGLAQDKLEQLGGTLFRKAAGTRAGQKAAQAGADYLAKHEMANTLFTLGKSFLAEGLEEAAEEPIQNWISRGVYDHDMPLWGEGGLLDGRQMLESGLMGGLVGDMYTICAGVSGMLGQGAKRKAERMLEKTQNGETVSRREMDELKRMAGREAAIQDAQEEIAARSQAEIEAAEQAAQAAAEASEKAEADAQAAREKLEESKKGVQPTIRALDEGTASFADPEIQKKLAEGKQTVKAAREAAAEAERGAQEAGEAALQAQADAEETKARVQEQARAEAEAQVDGETAQEAVAEAEAEQQGQEEYRERLRQAFAEQEQPGVKKLYNANVNLNEEQSTQLRILDALGRQYGLEFDIVEKLGDANAMYAGGRRIAVGLDAVDQAYVQAGAHEMVHYVRAMDDGSYTMLQEVVLEHLKESGLIDLEEAIAERMRQYEDNGHAIDREGAIEEIVAETVPAVFTNEDAVRMLVNRDRTLAEKIRDYFVNFAKKLRDIAFDYAVDSNHMEIPAVAENAKALMDIAYTFDDALEAARGKGGEFSGSSDFSIKTVNGKRIVWIEENILKGKPEEEKYTDYIANYLKEHIGEIYTVIESGQKVYLGEDLPGEYTGSRYTQRLRNTKGTIFAAKNRMTSGLGEMIEIATNRRWEKAKHAHNKDAAYGLYRYDSAVAFPVVNSTGDVTGSQAYDVSLIIRNAENGKKYLYDILGIKKDAVTADSLLERETRKTASGAAKLKKRPDTETGSSRGAAKNDPLAKSTDSVFTDIIPNSSEEVNDSGKFSLKDGSESANADQIAVNADQQSDIQNTENSENAAVSPETAQERLNSVNGRRETEADMKRLAGELARETGSGMKRAEITDGLMDVAERYAENGDAEGAAGRLARRMIEEGRPGHAEQYGMDGEAAAAELSLRIQGEVLDSLGRADSAQQALSDAQAMRERYAAQSEERSRQADRARAERFREMAKRLTMARGAGDEEGIRRTLEEYRQTRTEKMGLAQGAAAAEMHDQARTLSRETARMTRMIRRLDEMISSDDMDMNREKLISERDGYVELRDQLKRQGAALRRQAAITRAGMDVEQETGSWQAEAELNRLLDEEMAEYLKGDLRQEVRERRDKLIEEMNGKYKGYNRLSTLTAREVAGVFEDLTGEVVSQSQLAQVWKSRKEAATSQLFEERNQLNELKRRLRSAQAHGEAGMDGIRRQILASQERLEALTCQEKTARTQEQLCRRMGAVSMEQALREGRLPQPVMERIIAICADAGRTGKLNQTAAADSLEALRLFGTFPTRVWDDLFGEYSPVMRGIYFDPVMDNETGRQKWMAGWREKIAGLKLTKEESELVQKIGEGRISKPEEIAAAGEKVTEAVKVFRAFYEEAYDKTTAALTRNGYDKPGYIQKYFPHIDKAKGLFEKLGFVMENNTLPTSINGLTENFTPGRQYSGHLQQRTGKATGYDALYGFEQYINSVSNVIYHTDDIQRLRQLETEIRAAAKNGVFDDVKGQKAQGGESTHLSEFVKWVHEYTNLLAGKKGKLTRGLEEISGRNIYDLANRLKKAKGASAVMGNLGSAVTNLVPVVQAAADHPAAFCKGLFLAHRIAVTGRQNTPESQFMIRRFGSDSVIQTLCTRLSDKAGWAFDEVDLFATNAVVYSYYQNNLDLGMDSETAMRNADAQAARLMGDRSKGAMPNLYGDQILGFVTQFQLEVANQFQHFRKDIWREKGPAKALITLLSTAVLGWLANEAQEKVTGRRSNADPIQMSMDMLDAWKESGKPMEVLQACYNNVSDILPYSNLLEGGRVAAVDSIGDARDAFSEGKYRYGIEQLIFGEMPMGGQLRKMVKGYQAVKEGGVYSANGERLKYPVDSENPLAVGQAILFGPSSGKYAVDYYEGKSAELTKQETDSFRTQMGRGVSPVDAFEDETAKKNAAKLEKSAAQEETAYQDAQARADVGLQAPEMEDPAESAKEKREEAERLRANANPGALLTDEWYARKDTPEVRAGVALWRRTGKEWPLPVSYTAEDKIIVKLDGEEEANTRYLGAELAEEAGRLYAEGYEEIMGNLNVEALTPEDIEDIRKELSDLKKQVNDEIKERIRERDQK